MKFHEAYEALVNGSAKALRHRHGWTPGMYAALNENENGALWLYGGAGGDCSWDGAPMFAEDYEVVLDVKGENPAASFELLVERLRPVTRHRADTLRSEPAPFSHMLDCITWYAEASGQKLANTYVVGRGATHELQQLVAEIATCDSKADPKGILAAVRNFLLQRGYPDPEAKPKATPFDALVEELRVLLETPGFNSPCVVEAIFPLVVEHVVAFCRRNGVPVPPFFGGGTDTTPELIELFEQLIGADASTRCVPGRKRGDAQRQMLDALTRFFQRRGYPEMVAMVNVDADDDLPGHPVTDAEATWLEEAGYQRRVTPTERDAIDQALAAAYGDLHDEGLQALVDHALRSRVVENADPTRQIIDAAEKVRREIERAQRRYRVSDSVWHAPRFRWHL